MHPVSLLAIVVYTTFISSSAFKYHPTMLRGYVPTPNPLILAVQTRSLTKVRAVFMKYPDVNINVAFGHNMDTPLGFAASSTNLLVDIAVDLIGRGADIELPNDIGMRPLHLASRTQPVGVEAGVAITTIVDALLMAGAEINSIIPVTGTKLVYFQGETPLHFAARAGNRRLIKQLLLAGADPTIKNAEGRVAIQVCPSSAKSAFDISE